ncbi:MAG: beta-ketoacyl-[acyl-carrier-protein] synthase family protein [Planctomycetota bacterium]|nr:beta-ketoacyl-[acyl-carrier-protein] synthase family protein [Planctomycetota bacterium]
MSIRAVITGLGSVSPHGRGVRALWDGLLGGRSAFREVTIFDASVFRNAQAGEVDGYPAEEGKPARALRMLHDAAAEALRDALGLPESAAPEAIQDALAAAGLKNTALVAGTNFGGMSAVERALVAGSEDPAQASLKGYLFGEAGASLARRFGLCGPRFNLSLSCASGAAGLGVALDLIRQDRADAVLACGYDELSLYIYAGLSALRAITPETIRPFDKRRKGTLFSEGAAAVLVESEAHARARKAHEIHARILGRYMNNDAYHMTAPEQEATGIKALMRAALHDAGLGPESVDHLNLHATGTPYNDKIETKAVLEVFGARGAEIPVASVKSSIGHTMGAAGVHETVAAALTLREGKVPPVLGLDPNEQDPECGLRAPTGAPLAGEFKTILKTSYGFGGTNAALVLGKV